MCGLPDHASGMSIAITCGRKVRFCWSMTARRWIKGERRSSTNTTASRTGRPPAVTRPVRSPAPAILGPASERAKTLGVEDKCDFEVHDIREATLPPVDITTGLGLLDYLNGDELVQFLGKVHSKYFLFTFSEKKLSVMNALHLLYLKSQKCPSAYHYGEAEMRGFLEKADLNDFRFVRDPRMSIGTIVCHLPDSPLANTKI